MNSKNISDIKTADNFLKEYLPVFNKKFNVIPFSDTVNLDDYLLH